MLSRMQCYINDMEREANTSESSDLLKKKKTSIFKRSDTNFDKIT